jgi:hypothetical protein
MYLRGKMRDDERVSSIQRSLRNLKGASELTALAVKFLDRSCEPTVKQQQQIQPKRDEDSG